MVKEVGKIIVVKIVIDGTAENMVEIGWGKDRGTMTRKERRGKVEEVKLSKRIQRGIIGQE